jgi:ABC-type nickel/cobalt efflux system permease component RcnA
MRRVDAPPVVDKDVENRKKDDEERSGPLCLEADGDHDAGTEADDGNDHARECPCALKHKSDEKEYKEHAASQLETTEVKLSLAPN